MTSHSDAAVAVEVPGSKSLTIRALALAALSEGVSTLEGPLRSDDTARAISALSNVGAVIDARDDRMTIDGTGGSPSLPSVALDVGESGLTARIMIAIAALIPGKVTIVGRGRLSDRPYGPLLSCMEQMGGLLASDPRFPLQLEGTGSIAGGTVEVDVTDSSQFATAIMTVAPWADSACSVIVGAGRGSRGYLDMTAEVLRAFGGDVKSFDDGYRVEPGGVSATTYRVERDVSAAVYPMVAAAITGRAIRVPGVTLSSSQPDIALAAALEQMGSSIVDDGDCITVTGRGNLLDPIDIDVSGFPDGAMALAIACLFARGRSRLRGLHSWRLKESNRLDAMCAELSRVGASVMVTGDELTIQPRTLLRTTVKTHGDHRVAMSFGLLRLIDKGIDVDIPDVVGKTWPGFWGALNAMNGPRAGERPAVSDNVPPVTSQIITMDGPSGTGKSTVSRVVADRLGLPHLDTGAFYRAATLGVLRKNVELSNPAAVTEVVREMHLELDNGHMFIDGEEVSTEIRAPGVTAHVSEVAAHPELRSLLVEMQRMWVTRHGGSAVVEGRDIGSVVFPNATHKFYLDARPEVRARRRAHQDGADVEAVLADLERRDRHDSNRETSPLAVPDGALVIDTSDLSVDGVVDRILEMVAGQ